MKTKKEQNIQSIGTVVFAAAVVLHATQLFHPEGWGQFLFFFFSALFFFRILRDVMEKVAREKIRPEHVDSQFASLFAYQLFCATFLILLYIGLSFLIRNYSMSLSMLILLVANAFNISWLYRPLKKKEAFLPIKGAAALIFLILIFVIVQFSNDGFLLGMLLGYLAAACTVPDWLALREAIRFKDVTVSSILSCFRPALGALVPVLKNVCLDLYPVIVLALTQRIEQTGFYGAALFMAWVMDILLSLISIPMRSLFFVCGLGIAVSHPLLMIFCRSDFAGAWIPCLILLVCVMLKHLDKTFFKRIRAWYVLGWMIVCFGASLAFGAVGAALSYLLILAVPVIQKRREIVMQRYVLLPWAAGAFCGAWISSLWVLPWSLMAGAAVYIGIGLLILQLIKKARKA